MPWLAVIFIALLSACGQKGPLTLPQENDPMGLQNDQQSQRSTGQQQPAAHRHFAA